MKANQPNFANLEICVYEWQAWNGFLFPCIFPGACRIAAKMKQPISRIIDNLPPGTGSFLFHVNLTDTTHFYHDKEWLLEALKEKGIATLNEGVSNISKSFIQERAASLGLNSTRANTAGDPDERLIVKTNLNYGGMPEKKLSEKEVRQLNLPKGIYDYHINYPVLYRKEIGKEVWENKNLIVEKYISNKKNLFCRVYKLLNRVVISEVVDENQIKKMPVGIPRTNAYCYTDSFHIQPLSAIKYLELLKDIALFTEAIKLDFGALDVVISDQDEYYIIDVNTTPYWGGSGQQNMLDFLSGCREWME